MERQKARLKITPLHTGALPLGPLISCVRPRTKALALTPLLNSLVTPTHTSAMPGLVRIKGPPGRIDPAPAPGYSSGRIGAEANVRFQRSLELAAQTTGRVALEVSLLSGHAVLRRWLAAGRYLVVPALWLVRADDIMDQSLDSFCHVETQETDSERRLINRTGLWDDRLPSQSYPSPQTRRCSKRYSR